MIETWGFYFFPPERFVPVTELTPEDIQLSYDRYLDLWVKCEEWGFDGLSWPEHHFGQILSPSPHLLVATVAARTQRLRFTTLGSVLAIEKLQALEVPSELHLFSGVNHGFEMTPSLNEASATVVASFLSRTIVDPAEFAAEVARTNPLAAAGSHQS